jgi:hypothetical protein
MSQADIVSKPPRGSINWRRGFFRLWLVASVLWATFVLVLTYLLDQSPYLTAIAAPPAGAFVLGVFVWWVIAGFRRKAVGAAAK